MLVFLPRHSVATWQFVDLCLYRHATLPIGFPLWISRLVVGYFKEHEPNLLLRRYLLYSLMGAQAEDQLAFASGVGGDDDAIAPVETLADDIELLQGGRVVRIGRSFADLSDD